MKLVLVRHGRPDESQAAQDPALDADGQRQARAVARLLAAEGVTRIVASPLRRAQQTAEPLGRQLGLPVHTVDGWAEADRHLPVYRSTDTLKAQGAAEWQRFLADPVRYLGHEPEAFRAEVLAALAATVGDAPRNAQVVVFTHGLVINQLLSHLLGLERIVHFQPGYGSITRLRARSATRLGVVSVNECGHHAWPEPEASA